MSQQPQIERRKLERRQLAARRAAPARRTGQRKRRPGRQVEVEQERRTGKDRRIPLRRGGRRRRRFDRRVGDRRERPAAFSRRQVAQIRQLVADPSMPNTCSHCKDALTITAPTARHGSTGRDVVCTTCHRCITIVDYTVAHILVIDSNNIVRGALRKLLASAGHEVTGAPNAEAGLAYYRTSPADVVLVDMTTPDTNGLEFIRLCRKEFPEVRIVAMPGQRRAATPDPVPLATSLGVVQTLRKPFAQGEVLQVLDELLKR